MNPRIWQPKSYLDAAKFLKPDRQKLALGLVVMVTWFIIFGLAYSPGPQASRLFSPQPMALFVIGWPLPFEFLFQSLTGWLVALFIWYFIGCVIYWWWRPRLI